MLQPGGVAGLCAAPTWPCQIQLTVDTYGKWLPIRNKGAVDRLDEVARNRAVATGGRESSKLWSWREESNLQPVVYKTTALPIELRQHQAESTRQKFLLQVFAFLTCPRASVILPALNQCDEEDYETAAMDFP
jgi:hypothetical protein